MHFRGKATVAITEGSTTNPTISGYTFGTNGASALAGDVILDSDSEYEYVWTADGTSGKWEKLGSSSSYALSTHDHNSTYLKLDGSNTMSADVNILTGDTNKFINFWYNTNKKAGASWRTGVLGTGSSDTNYFTIESGTSSTTATTWNTVLQIG